MLAEGDLETKPARVRLGFRQCIGESYRMQDGAKTNEWLGREPRGETRKPTYDNGSGSQLLVCGVVDDVRELRPDISFEAKYTVKRRHTLPNIKTSACSSSIPARLTVKLEIRTLEDTWRPALERPWYSTWSILGA